MTTTADLGAPSDDPRLGDMHRVFAGAGSMAPLLLDLDWGATSVGWPSAWPQSLRSSVSICLGAKYPIAIYWGEDLTLIYNEAWSLIPGDKHPWALGRPGRLVWPDIWDIVGPQFDDAMSGVGTWTEDQLLPMQRHGFLEETYFNYNLSPITAEDGRIEGVFNAGIETSQRVLTMRRNGLLLSLMTEAVQATTVEEACRAAAGAMTQDPATIPMAALYLFDDTGPARLAATVRLEPGSPVSPAEIELADPRFGFAELRRSRSPVVLDELFSAAPLEPVGDWPEPPRRALALPIMRGGFSSLRRILGALVVAAPPGRPVDQPMLDFFDLLTEQLASAIVNARAEEEERRVFETEHNIATTLQQSLIPELPAVDGIELFGRYLPGSAEVEVGGDWYDAVPLPDGQVAVVIGDVVGKGVAAAAQMGQLRNAVRAYLLEGFSPAEVIAKLNHLTISLSGTSFATVVCLFHDPATGRTTWCRAGHLPPMVRRADGSVEVLDGGGSPPIAVFDDSRFVDAETHLAPGDVVVLYTDGLVERRDEDIDVGLDRLAVDLGALPGSAQAVEQLVAPLAAADRRDDVAVVALAVPAG